MVEMRLIRIHMPRVMLLYGRNSLPRLFEIEFIHQEFGGGAIFRTSFWKEVWEKLAFNYSQIVSAVCQKRPFLHDAVFVNVY